MTASSARQAPVCVLLAAATRLRAALDRRRSTEHSRVIRKLAEDTRVTYPQPHEDITGIDRHGDPVVDTPGVSGVLATLAWHLNRAVRVPHSPIQDQLNNRITRPEPDDLVVVLDAINHNHPGPRGMGVGYLVEHRTEWANTDAEWIQSIRNGEAHTNEPRVVERHAWYVQYGPDPADVCRWVNCTVLAVPKPRQRWM